MSCHTNNCPITYPSNCVTWQGDPIPALGICKGDSLTETTVAIIEQLEAALDGSGIILSDVTTDCSFISDQLAGKNKSLFNLIQVLISSSCTLKELIDSIETTVGASVTYDDKGIITPTEPGTPGTVQGIINELFDVSTTVDTLTTGLPTTTIVEAIASSVGNALINQISAPTGLTHTGSGASAQLQLSGFIPPYCPIPCFAPLSNWESNGKGKVGSIYEGWIIVGTNGTSQYDMRGYSFAGATNLPGINFDVDLQSVVDPTVNGDPSYGTSIGDRKGEVKHQIAESELPSISISGTTDPHSHTLEGLQISVPAGESFQDYNVLTNGGSGIQTSDETVSFTSDSIGGGIKMENRQPTIYGYYIMRLS